MSEDDLSSDMAYFCKKAVLRLFEKMRKEVDGFVQEWRNTPTTRLVVMASSELIQPRWPDFLPKWQRIVKSGRWWAHLPE